MARRKKEPKSVHRENIAAAASKLFMEKGITATSMNEIAKIAGYSKATLYVYFENKEEIIGKETYQIGEEINEKLKDFLITGMKKGDLREDLEIMPAIFHFWGMLSGLIQLAANKEEYIEKVMHLSKNQFLEYGMDMLYRSIAQERVK
ncbi:MAG: TetR/AcrR family transcriptional regulator [Lachnospiraceae bacterium]|nr:TetR/AcrR family transcriptional regulator [Lachnospiraceae bacterium]